jgi:predicted DsbA family dithiol-disulfide isomerase
MNPTDFTPASRAEPSAASADCAIRIDVISDVVCPWCFIGKRQLEAAVAVWREAHPDAPAPQIVWHPFQLNPDLPPEGIARDDYLMRKFGRTDVAQLFRNVSQVALSVGLALKLDQIGRQPNTQRAHALMTLAQDDGRQDALAEALFNAYFIEARDLTDEATLKAVAIGAGLDAGKIDDVLHTPEPLAAVSRADHAAREAGVSGVPYFIFNGRIGVSGAQGAERLLKALGKAASIAATVD